MRKKFSRLLQVISHSSFQTESVVLRFSAEGAEDNKCLFIVVKKYLFSNAHFIFVRPSDLLHRWVNFHTFCNTVYLLQLNHGKLPLPNKTLSLWWWVYTQ